MSGALNEPGSRHQWAVYTNISQASMTYRDVCIQTGLRNIFAIHTTNGTGRSSQIYQHGNAHYNLTYVEISGDPACVWKCRLMSQLHRLTDFFQASWSKDLSPRLFFKFWQLCCYLGLVRKRHMQCCKKCCSYVIAHFPSRGISTCQTNGRLKRSNSIHQSDSLWCFFSWPVTSSC